MQASRWLGSVRRIALLYGVTFAVVTALFGTVVYFATQQALEQQVDVRLASETASVLGGRNDPIGVIAGRIRLREGRRGTSDIGYLLVDASRRRVAGKLSLAIPPAGYANISFRDNVEGIDRGRALTTPLADRGVLILVADSEPVEAFDMLMIRIFVLAFGAAALVGALGGFALTATIGRRIAAIDRTAEAIIDGDLSQRMAVDGSGGEFDRHSATLNRMLDRTSELMANLKQVSADIAHDLRTPLARLRNRLEHALSPKLGLSEARAEIDQGLVQVDAILELFAAILRISEIEAGHRRAGFRGLDLGAVVRDVVDSFAPSIEEKGRSVFVNADGALPMSGDPELLAQLVINLLENASHHTPAGTCITVETAVEDGEYWLSVTDDGPGIGTIDPDVLKRRFHRLERSRSLPGNGLGLPLVEAIARLHGGSVNLHDLAPGLRVDVMLATGSGPRTEVGARGLLWS